MRKAWVMAGPPAAAPPGQVRVGALSKADEPALGRLMWLAFQGSADDEYTVPGDADAEAAGPLAGRWGPVVWQASRAAELDSGIVSAVIVVLDDAHEGLPLLAFAMTDPARQRRGIGRWLIEESVRRLDAIGVKELHLAVTRGNPAFALYQRLGFEVVPGRQDPGARGYRPELVTTGAAVLHAGRPRHDHPGCANFNDLAVAAGRSADPAG